MSAENRLPRYESAGAVRRSFTAFPGLDDGDKSLVRANAAGARPFVPQHATAAPTAEQLGAAPARAFSLVERAAREPRAADAVVMIREALGFADSELAAFYVQLDDGRAWKRASTANRLGFIAEWIKFEVLAIASEIDGVTAPAPLHMVGASE